MQTNMRRDSLSRSFIIVLVLALYQCHKQLVTSQHMGVERRTINAISSNKALKRACLETPEVIALTVSAPQVGWRGYDRFIGSIDVILVSTLGTFDLCSSAENISPTFGVILSIKILNGRSTKIRKQYAFPRTQDNKLLPIAKEFLTLNIDGCIITEKLRDMVLDAKWANIPNEAISFEIETTIQGMTRTVTGPGSDVPVFVHVTGTTFYGTQLDKYPHFHESHQVDLGPITHFLPSTYVDIELGQENYITYSKPMPVPLVGVALGHATTIVTCLNLHKKSSDDKFSVIHYPLTYLRECLGVSPTKSCSVQVDFDTRYNLAPYLTS